MHRLAIIIMIFVFIFIWSIAIFSKSVFPFGLIVMIIPISYFFAWVISNERKRKVYVPYNQADYINKKEEKQSQEQEFQEELRQKQEEKKRQQQKHQRHDNQIDISYIHANWYDILGVPINASIEDIKYAYQKRISEYHPDKVTQLGAELRELAKVKSQQINVAYKYAQSQRLT